MSCNSLIGQWMNAPHSWNYHQLSWPFERGLSLLDSNFHGLVVDIPPLISSMSEKNSAAAPGGFSLFCCHILENEYLTI